MIPVNQSTASDSTPTANTSLVTSVAATEQRAESQMKEEAKLGKRGFFVLTFFLCVLLFIFDETLFDAVFLLFCFFHIELFTLFLFFLCSLLISHAFS
jgi:hypothetical protein